MYDEERSVEPVTMGRVVHVFAPWIALALVAMLVWGAWNTFESADKPEWGAGSTSSTPPTSSVSATGSASASSTVVTGIEAVARKVIKLRALPNDTSEILASAEKGDVLEILNKDAGHFRVKDKNGHVGWIPNDTEYITVRDKKK